MLRSMLAISTEAVAFYADVFGLKKLDEGEGDAFFKLGEHQFLAMFENKRAVLEREAGILGSWFATRRNSRKCETNS